MLYYRILHIRLYQITSYCIILHYITLNQFYITFFFLYIKPLYIYKMIWAFGNHNPKLIKNPKKVFFLFPLDCKEFMEPFFQSQKIMSVRTR